MSVTIVGICGASGSGKTTLATELIAKLGGAKSDIVRLDDCFQTSRAPFAKGKARNMETPEGINYKKLADLIQQAKQKFNSATSKGSAATTTSTFKPSKRFVIVEGFLLFSDPTILSLLDVKIFLIGNKETCYQRRLQRRKRKNEEEFKEYFDQFVWPCYELYNKHVFEDESIKKQIHFLDSVTLSESELVKECSKILKL